MLSLSTALRSEISDSGAEIVREILSFGVQAVELEYRITEAMLQEIIPFVKKREILVGSIHNIMPLPDGMEKATANGEFVSLSSPEESERRTAVEYAQGTLHWAEVLGAQAVVLHMGKTSLPNPTRKLIELYDERRIREKVGKEFLGEQMKLREQAGERRLQAALRSLETLAREAEKRRIFLGIENRYGLQDFPNIPEFQVIFQKFKGAPVRYWHDMGHATTQENFGIMERGELLERFGGYLTGVHIHGCRGYKDHYAPGSGEEDYGQLKRFLRVDTLRVIETHHRASREELLQGLEFLRTEGIS